jgi:hypothetical protein
MDQQRLDEIRARWKNTYIHEDIFDLLTEVGRLTAELAAMQRYVEPSAKTDRTCATCASCKPSDKTNRLFCIYHGEYDHEHETYADDYCSNWERKEATHGTDQT